MMKLLLNLPLRSLIPGILIVSSTLVGVAVTLERLQREQEAIVQTSKLNMVELMSQVQEGVSDRMQHDDLLAANLRISSAALARNVNVLHLVDEEGVILLSSQYAMRGRPVFERVPHFNTTTATRSELYGRVMVEVSPDRQDMHGYFPIVLGQERGSLRPNRHGVLFVDYDLSKALSAARDRAIRQSLIFVGAFMLLTLLLVAFFRWRVTRRVETLASTVSRFARGDLTQRAELTGGDELAYLAGAFNEMAVRLEDKNRQLEAEVEERKAAAQALRDSQQMLQLVLDTIPAGVFWKDQNLTYLGCNRMFAHDAGLPAPQNVVGCREADLVWQQLAERYEADDLQVISSGEAKLDAEEMTVMPDGEIIWLQISKIPLRDDSGEITGLLGTYQNITARKLSEEALKNLNETLEQRVRDELAKNREKDHLLIQQSRLAAMGEMVHNIAHQWRQPLNIMGLVVSGIKDDFEYGSLTRERMQESVETAQRLLQKMSTTIDDFRNFFRPDKEKQDFDIARVVRDTVVLMEASLKNNAITLKLELEEPVMVEGYPAQYSQALLNLIVNAKEAIQQKKIAHGSIEIRLQRHQGEAVLSVEDNAGGIPQAIMPQLFDPYFTTKDQGSGIGLYMTKMIIESNMQGRVKAENTEQGAKLTLIVPLAEGAHAPTA